MGIPTEFKLNGDSDYTLWNGQTAFSGQTAKPRMPILRAPEDSQAIAVTWNKTTKAFTSVYFELIQEGDEQVIAAGATGHRIAGKFKGSDLFIISLPGKKLPVDLRENLTQWVETKYLFDNEGSQQKIRRRDRSMTIGALTIEIEKLIGKLEVTPKPAAPAVLEQPAQPAQAARPPERPATILGAAREVLQRPAQSYVAGQDFEGTVGADDLPYSGVLKKDFERGFTFVAPDKDIAELNGRDAFLHISRIARSGYPDSTTLRGGDRIRFNLWDNKGQIQIDEIQKFGEPRPRKAVQVATDDADDLLGNVIEVPDDLETRVHRGTVVRISSDDAQFRHIRPDHTIRELDGKDAFVHFNQVPDAEGFREGDRVEFQLELSPQGRIQVYSAWREGEPRPQQSQEHSRDRSYDQRQEQPFERSDYVAADEGAQTERRGRVVIREIPIQTPMGPVVPGGAWRNVRNDRDPS